MSTGCSRRSRAYLEEHADHHPRPLDYVLVDCPPSLGLLTLNALVAAREVLLPIQCEYYALEGLGQLLKTIELVREHLNPALRVSAILLTMFDARTRLAADVADQVRGHFGALVLPTVIPRSVRVSEAPSPPADGAHLRPRVLRGAVLPRGLARAGHHDRSDYPVPRWADGRIQGG